MKLLGLISPNLDDATIQEYHKFLPEGIRIEGRALTVGRFTAGDFKRVEEAFAGVVRELTQQPLDFLMVTGELFLSFRGPGSDQLVLDSVREISPTPASTVLTAVVRALRQMKCSRIVMASPFPHDQDVGLVRFLAYYDIQVAAFHGLGYDNTDVIWNLPADTGYQSASALLSKHKDVDGIYMPCNKWRVSPVIDRLEEEFGKPVITNTQAWIWEALQGMGMMQQVRGLGRLFNRAQD